MRLVRHLRNLEPHGRGARVLALALRRAKVVEMPDERTRVLVLPRVAVGADELEEGLRLELQGEEVLVDVADHVPVRVALDHHRVAPVVEYEVWLQHDDALVPLAHLLDGLVELEDLLQ